LPDALADQGARQPDRRAQTVTVDGEVAGNIVAWWQDDRRFVGYWFGHRWRSGATVPVPSSTRKRPGRLLSSSPVRRSVVAGWCQMERRVKFGPPSVRASGDRLARWEELQRRITDALDEMRALLTSAASTPATHPASAQDAGPASGPQDLGV